MTHSLKVDFNIESNDKKCYVRAVPFKDDLQKYLCVQELLAASKKSLSKTPYFIIETASLN
jgi:hypothetical protein